MSDKKKFKETAFGKLVLDKIPDAAGVIGDLLPSSGLLGVIKNIIDTTSLTDEDRRQLTQAQMDFEIRELQLYMEDIKDSRALQRAALEQGDKFSKRFNYYLAAISVFLGFGYIFFITLYPIPANNQRFADTILGVVIAVVFGNIYNFFFGSSKGSQEKTEMLRKGLQEK